MVPTIQCGITGRILAAIRSLYQGFKCSIRLNGIMSDWFGSTCGVKQGCLMSPTLFDLYVDTLATDIQQGNTGIDYNGVNIGILMYADDVVLLANTPAGLQTQLNILNDWCRKWRLSLNRDKTSVIVFRPRNKELQNLSFKCGNVPIGIVAEYKYLGILLTEHLEWNKTVSALAASASRALGLVIAKAKSFGGFPHAALLAAYNGVVRPIIEYAAEIWGYREYNCVNNIFWRACRNFLGVGRYTPKDGIIGDLGWTPPNIRQQMCVTRLWCRLIHMDDIRLTKKVFNASFHLQQTGRVNWCKHAVKLFSDNRCEQLLDFNYVKIHAIKYIVKQFELKVKCIYQEKWFQRLQDDTRVNPCSRNKLRCYRNFKSEIYNEPYTSIIMKKRYRTVFAKFCLGVAPLRIETDRYSAQYIPPEQRICLLCHMNSIEDEMHVLCQCPTYTAERVELFTYAIDINSDFSTMNDAEKFIYLMSNAEMCKITAMTCCLILDKRRDFLQSINQSVS
jgi:hypothetical protein